MKKILGLIILLLMITSVFADPTYSGTDSGSSATMTLGLTATSGFTDSTSTQKGHIVFGFTADNTVSDTITPTDTLILSEDFDSTGEIVVAKGVVYAFVRVASLSKLNFSIEWTDLTKTTSDKISYQINGSSSPYTFYTFDPTQNVMVDIRPKLQIVTGEYTNADKVGTYESTITMRVTVGS